MVTVSIGGMSVPAERVSEGWINQMIAEARRMGGLPCVRVQIETPGANMTLATPGCGGGAGGRPPNQLELRIFRDWERRRLNSDDFAPGELRAFLNDLSRLI